MGVHDSDKVVGESDLVTLRPRDRCNEGIGVPIVALEKLLGAARSGHVHDEVSRHPSCVEVVLSVSHLNFCPDFSKTECTIASSLQVNSPAYLQ